MKTLQVLSSPTAPTNTTALLQADQLYKNFVLHHQGGVQLPVLKGVSLTVCPGECVALQGPSGSGKSTFMRSLYANYRIDSGSIWIKHQEAWVDLPQLEAHELIEVRQHTLGYVSQFLRVIPRVPAVEIAAATVAASLTARELLIYTRKHVLVIDMYVCHILLSCGWDRYRANLLVNLLVKPETLSVEA